MVDVMKGQQHRDRIPRLLPPTVAVANKTGSFFHIRSDVALVLAPGAPFVITLFLMDGPLLLASEAVFSDVASVAYEHFARQTAFRAGIRLAAV